MNPRRPAFILIALAVLGVGGAWSQQPQIDQVRQLDARTSPGGSAPASTAAIPDAAAPTAGTDSDSFGVQQFLREKERLRPFRVFAEVSAFVTNNIALSRRDARSDAFLIAVFGMEYRRPVASGLQFDASLRYASFRYDKYGSFDFSSLDAGTGLSYHAEKLGGLDFSARYNFNALIGGSSDEVFFKNHTITLGMQKAVSFSSAHYAFVGVSGQAGFADPKRDERAELSAFLGYHVQPVRRLEADLLYRYGRYIYSEGGRRDHNQTLSLALWYRFTDWLGVTASTFATWNRSDRQVYDYNAANLGGGLSLSLQF